MNCKLRSLGYRPVGVVLFLLFFATPSYGDFSKTWKVASGSVVSILPTWPGYSKPGFGAPPGTAPEGTGIIVSKNGIVITASHVISKATEIEVRDFSGSITLAVILFDDPKTDLAVLKTSLQAPAIVFATEKPEIGTETCLISNSFGLNLGITCGVVSAVGRSNIGFNQVEDFIQTDAASNPGSSGGALVDKDGKLIGMMSGIFTKNTDTNSGVNFAISTNLIKKTILEYID